MIIAQPYNPIHSNTVITINRPRGPKQILNRKKSHPTSTKLTFFVFHSIFGWASPNRHRTVPGRRVAHGIWRVAAFRAPLAPLSRRSLPWDSPSWRSGNGGPKPTKTSGFVGFNHGVTNKNKGFVEGSRKIDKQL